MSSRSCPDPTRSCAGEYVAIGAHNDHIGFGGHVPSITIRCKVYNAVARPAGRRRRRAEDLIRRRVAADRNAIDSLHKLHGGPRARFDLQWRRRRRQRHRVGPRDRRGVRAGARSSRSARSSSSGTRAKRRDSGARSTSPIIRPCRAIRSWRSSTSTWSVAGGRATSPARQGRRRRCHGGDKYLQLVGSRRLSTDSATSSKQSTRTSELGFTFDYALDADGHPQNIYCRSDHAEYARYGIPVVFFTTGGHADYHQVTDEAAVHPSTTTWRMSTS